MWESGRRGEREIRGRERKFSSILECVKDYTVDALNHTETLQTSRCCNQDGGSDKHGGGALNTLDKGGSYPRGMKGDRNDFFICEE